MNDTGIVDTFLGVYSRYIDSGFGLLGGEVGFLSTTLIAIDVTLAALFWAWGADEDILQRLVRKTLYIGVFAFIIGNFANLADIVFRSFAGLGLKASGGALALGDFMKPGTIAATGLGAARPFLDATADLLGPVGLFANFVQIVILLLGWVIVVIAFFLLAVQIFVTIIEFKLVALAGFVLLPFAFFGRTAFMAERVLGHIVSSGVKVLVLAVVTGIGTTLFGQFTASPAAAPDLDQVMAMALAALTLLGLGIFAPGIANGIVTGGPQLGAGAAAGTALAAGATLAGGVAGTRLAAGALAGAASTAASGSMRAAGALSAAYTRGAAGRSGADALGGGLAALGRSAGGAVVSPLRRAAERARQQFAAAAHTGPSSAVGPSAAPEAPAWAKSIKQRQAITHGAGAAAHTLGSGDSHGGGGGPDLSEKD